MPGPRKPKPDPSAAADSGDDNVTPIRKKRPVSEAQRQAGIRNVTAGRIAHQDRIQRAKQMRAEGHKSRYDKLISGEMTVKDLDTDELMKRQCRGLAGGWDNPRSLPMWLSRQWDKEVVNRHNTILRGALVKVSQALVEMANDPNLAPKDRLRAMENVMDRAVGKPIQRNLNAEIADGESWQETFEGIVFEKPGEDADAG